MASLSAPATQCCSSSSLSYVVMLSMPVWKGVPPLLLPERPRPVRTSSRRLSSIRASAAGLVVRTEEESDASHPSMSSSSSSLPTSSPPPSAPSTSAAASSSPPTSPKGLPEKVAKLNVDLGLWRARRLRRQGRYREAEAGFRRCLELLPTDGRAYVALARMEQIAGRPERARALYEAGVAAVEGNNPFLWQSWGVFEEQQGNLSKARDLFDSATVADPKHGPSWHAWAMLEKRDGNLRKARDLLVKGARYDPGNAFLYQSLALMESDAGRLDNARHYFQLGVRTNPSSAALWQAWALMEVEAGNTYEARRLFKRGTEEVPRNCYLWQAWAIWESKQGGHPDTIRELLEKCTKLNRRDPANWQAWALFEHKQGNLETARRLFEEGVRADSSHQPVWQAWAVMEFREGNLDKARELFQKGVWADPTNKNVAKLFQAWGVLEDRQSNIAFARALYKCAVKADPSSVPSWMAWAQMEERLGDLPRADELRNLCMEKRTETLELDVRPSSMTLVTAAAEAAMQDPHAVANGAYYPGKPGVSGILAPMYDQVAAWMAAWERQSNGNGKSGVRAARPGVAKGSNGERFKIRI